MTTIFYIIVIILSTYNQETIVYCRNKNMLYARHMIQTEVEKRFENPVIYMVHGDVDVPNEWYLVPDNAPMIKAKDEMEKLKKAFPNRTIVLWSCNKDGDTLGVDGIYYFKQMVNNVPDEYLPYRTAAGEIFTFIGDSTSSIWDADCD